MMGNFKFVKNKNKFKWVGDSIILEFSNPSIQTYDEFLEANNIEDILYYYYCVRICKKYEDYDKNEREIIKTELVSETYTHDFPCISQLQYMINNFIENDDNHIMSTQGLACDDFYEIIKHYDNNYSFYCGVSYNIQSDLNSEGIRVSNITIDDLKELKKCVNSFIEYSIDSHNEEVKKYNNNFEIIGNKLYEYDNLEKTKIYSILTEGERVSIIEVKDNKQNEYNNCIIKNINYINNTIAIECNYLEGEKDKCLYLKNIRYINSESCYDKVYYNLEETLYDFIDILNKNEKEEFKTKDVNFLLNKYIEAIVHRTAICRDEHGFNINHSLNYPEKCKPVVEKIIIKIKEYLYK